MPRVYFRTLISADNTFISRKFSQRNLSFWNAPHLFPLGPHPPSSQTTHSSHLRHVRRPNTKTWHVQAAAASTSAHLAAIVVQHQRSLHVVRALISADNTFISGKISQRNLSFRTRVGIFPRTFPETQNVADPLISLRISGNSRLGQIRASFAVGCPGVTKNGLILSHRTGLYLLVKKKGPKLTRQVQS